MPLPANLTGALMGLGAFAAFSFYDVMTKVAGGGLPAPQVLFMAGAFSLPALWLLARLQGDRGAMRPRHPWIMALRVAVILTSNVLGVYAFATLPLATCYAIFFSMPMIITLMAWPLLNEPIDAWRGTAVAVGFCGVVYALDPGAETLTMGHFAAAGAALASATNFVIIRKVGRSERGFVMQAWPMIGQVVVLAPAMLLLAQPVDAVQIGTTALMGLGMVTGMGLLIAAFARAPSIVVSPMQYSQILWAAFYGAMFFDEALTQRMTLGMAVIIAAGVAILARPAPAAG